jgi:hypothetical protein
MYIYIYTLIMSYFLTAKNCQFKDNLIVWDINLVLFQESYESYKYTPRAKFSLSSESM